MTAIGVVSTSLNTAMTMIKALAGIRDANLATAKVWELQQVIIEAQQSVFALQQERTKLVEQASEAKEKIRKLEAWQAEKKRYRLEEVAPRVFAYVYKTPVQRTGAPMQAAQEPVHWICTACYQRGEKSILQGFKSAQAGWAHSCPSCKAVIHSE